MQDNEIVALLSMGVEETLIPSELLERIKTKETLIIKAGFDPTSPDLHLGHTVLINKLKQFQDLGHTIVFIIGDYTAMIGDPTGKNVTRAPISKEGVLENARTYKEQIFKILDENKTQIRFNSQWLDGFSAADLIKLASKSTVARMLERDDFSKRFKENQSIAIHEFLYPLLQGYDSVEIKADIELGGTDQKFNLLVGRELQRHYKQRPQIVMTMPIIEGLDGKKKMSKSLNNYIGIMESPSSMFGKLMSLSDILMWKYITCLSLYPKEITAQWKVGVDNGRNPREIKVMFAKEIVQRFHNKDLADIAHLEFEQQFRDKLSPKDIPLVKLGFIQDKPLANVLKEAKLVASTSEALRLIKQGGVKINDKKVESNELILNKNVEYKLQVGKRRFARVVISLAD